MPEQQHGDDEQHARNNSTVLVEKKAIPLFTQHVTRIHKRKYHHKRQHKYPASYTTTGVTSTPDNKDVHDIPLPSAQEEAPPVETIAETSQPSTVEGIPETPTTLSEWDVETDPALPAITKKLPAVEPVVPSTPPIVEEIAPLQRQGDRKGLPYIFARLLGVRETLAVSLPRILPLKLSWRTLLAYALLALLLTSTVLLWQDLTATHVYISTLDTNNGSLQAQQDLFGYMNDVRLTAPVVVNDSSHTIALGVYAPEQNATQQMLTLHYTSSNVSLQHSASLANAAITQDTSGHVLIESADGLQVGTPNGQVLWHVEGQQSTLGVHPFTPVSDNESVYTIASATHSQIASYVLANGHIRWTQTLPDTLEYAPPFVLNGGMLYVATDHNVFALNSTNGVILWEKSYASRTLLVENEGQRHLLLALSSQGIQALQSETGTLVWSFRGDPAISTIPTQFYQGTIGHSSAAASNTIYATGVVWHMPDVREDVWLYAIDGTTGNMQWSRQIALGPMGADAGRILQPLLDGDNSNVLLQRATDTHEIAVTAFDATTGAQRWNTPITDTNISSPTVLQLSKSTFVVFTTTTNSLKILLTPSFYRASILLFLFVSIFGLLSLTLLRVGTASARPSWQSKGDGGVIHRFLPIPFGEKDALKRFLHAIRKHWQRAYTILSLVLVAVCVVSIGVFSYTTTHQPARQVLMSDAQGSVVITDAGKSMYQLEAFAANGGKQWKLFSSEGTFSLPKAQVQPGTLLVALSGDTAHSYSVASDDLAYPHPLDSMLALYLLDRSTGHILWQQVVSYPDEHQYSEVIGADTTYIYVAGEHTLFSSTQSRATSVTVPQLFAVNKLTGTIDWRIFGPTQSTSTKHSMSTVLIQHEQVLWHVGNTVFTIDAHVGQIIGRT